MLVEARALWKVFASRPVLKDVGLRVSAGEVVAVLGPNGAGKTTLLRLLAGILRPTRGEVLVGGRPISADRTVRQHVGFAGHASFLYGHLTARENLQFYADLYGLPGSRADEMLEHFDLTSRRHELVRMLSRGLVQRLSLARALLHDPTVLLLDEPFTGLDASGAPILATAVGDFRRQGKAVVLATHAWKDAHDLADRAAILIRGKLAATEPAATLDGTRLAVLYQSLPDGSGTAGQLVSRHTRGQDDLKTGRPEPGDREVR